MMMMLIIIIINFIKCSYDYKKASSFINAIFFKFLFLCRLGNFEKGDDYKKTWKGNDDGKVNSHQPMRMEDDRDGCGGNASMITRSVSQSVKIIFKFFSFFLINFGRIS